MTARATPRHLPAKGNCYEAAFHWIMAHPSTCKLVHGRPIRAVSPFCQFGHAWIESGETVYDAASGRFIPKSVYYRAGQIDPSLCVSYTWPQARKLALKHGHCGPWEGVDA